MAILGPGLLGGSMGLALRKRYPEVEVRMWGRRPEVLEEARRLEMASQVFSECEQAVEGAELVVLCVPVGVMEGLVRRVLPFLGKETLVTDVGSVKGEVVSALEPLLRGRALFVGSHPMAGSDRSGLAAARADLFEGAVCILTPEGQRNSKRECTAPEAVSRARAFWEGMGCRVRELEPRLHDEVCSRISHVPHVAAAALVNAVGDHLPAAFDFCGPGFRDTTRVAGGLPEMWSEILLSNREAVAEGLRQVVAQFESVIQVLERTHPGAEAELLKFLAEAKRQRDRLRSP